VLASVEGGYGRSGLRFGGERLAVERALVKVIVARYTIVMAALAVEAPAVRPNKVGH
jgi:hypothetical protein